MADRATASTSADPRASSESTLEVRLGALANALGRTLRDLRDRVESVERRVADRVDAIERQIAELPDIGSRTTSDLRAVLRHLEALQQRVGAAPEAVSGQRIEERLSSIPGEVAEKVDRATEGMRKSFDAMPPAFAQSLEPLRGLPKRFQEAAGRVEDAVSQLREAHQRSSEGQAATGERLAKMEQRLEKMADRLVDPVELTRAAREATEVALDGADFASIAREATGSALATFGEEQERRAAALEKALGRVDKLSEALGSLERRRGARELLEGEQKLLEQQEALVRTVTETANQLGGRVLAIEGEISAILERVDEKRFSQEVGEHVRGAVAELQQTISHELGTRLSNAIAAISKAAADRVAQDVGGRVENLRDELAEDAARVGTEIFERAGAAMSEEIRGMRAKIDSWGRARTAPKVAEEIAAMERRIDKVALTVEEELVDAVFDRMQRVFDRRFEVLIQMVETRISDALPKRREEPPPSHRRRLLRRNEGD